MQQPTLRNIRIRSTRDAVAVFYGVARNILPLITRRLDAEERLSIVAGCCFVWEENANSEATGLGMERWTDGMGWGPSRVRDEFLFYHQKESDGEELAINPITPWAQMMRKRASRLGTPSSSRRPTEAQRLIKQTYSVLVSLPKDRPTGIVRKWHLTAYFNQETLNELNTIDDLRYLDVPIPDGWFRSARATKARRDSRTIPEHTQVPEGIISSPLDPALVAQTRYRGPPSAPPQNPGIAHASTSGSGRLVPLEYLQNATQRNRRDPTDEQFLRRFGS
ncbi:Gti1/Pac2 family-domain-containing protein [Roridomyces roridus]|uniref:Gti1/Pac2 family-domain-containing protein n=1 Tax=Roridomyces roridus TaxID=1738132 RepID=A0AAD7C4B4_9AGAR|nr:Gti1/Pac2 family-domain-containing protein [Roridomyces roridus]